MIDLVSEPEPSKPEATPAPTDVATPTERKFVGVRFNCCGIYIRIYVNKEGTAYEGHCPKCFKPIRLKIGSGGTNNRFFDAY
ncbi:hypothetical protein FACS189454_02040 [Planctomycetales bacterium]|nr:hypothetical protein FACS189454_02040 [Planctomycetales bacterium]